MQLSESIRLGAMLRPQTFGKLFYAGASCAMGAAVVDRRRRPSEARRLNKSHRHRLALWTTRQRRYHMRAAEAIRMDPPSVSQLRQLTYAVVGLVRHNLYLADNQRSIGCHGTARSIEDGLMADVHTLLKRSLEIPYACMDNSNKLRSL